MNPDSTPTMSPATSVAQPVLADAENPGKAKAETAHDKAMRHHQEILKAREVMSTAKLGNNETVLERSRKSEQKLAKVQRDQAKDQFAIMASLVKTAEAVGFERCPLGKVGLMGALADVLERSESDAGREVYEAKGRALLAKHEVKAPGAVQCAVEAANYGDEFKAEAKRLGLRHDSFRGVYQGRASIAELISLATRFAATVQIKHEGNLTPLVDAGTVDANLLTHLSPNVAAESGTAAGVVLPDTAVPAEPKKEEEKEALSAAGANQPQGFGQPMPLARTSSSGAKS